MNKIDRIKQANEILSKVELGMTRKEVVAALGLPSQTSFTTKKRKHPNVYKYGEIELCFTDGYYATLWLVYSEDGFGNDPITHAMATEFRIQTKSGPMRIAANTKEDAIKIAKNDGHEIAKEELEQND